MLNPPRPYPVNALPDGLREVVHQLHHAVLVPLEIVASSALGAIALASQRGYAVERRPGIVYPVSLAFLTIAGISERKSSTDRRLQSPIRNFEHAQEIQQSDRLNDWKTSQAILSAKKTGITRTISKLTAKGENTSIQEQELQVLMRSAAEKPKQTRLVVKMTSTKELLHLLHNHGGSCGVMVDEGSVFFNSSAAKNAGVFAQLWSGDDIQMEALNDKGFTVRNPRVSMSIMVQPEVLQTFLEGKGRHWRNTGLLSRFLVSYPVSMMGSRVEDTDWPATADLRAYDVRVLEILSSAPCQGTSKPIVLRFDEAARKELAAFSNEIELEIAPSRYFSEIKDAASKIAENTARIAAIFHIYEGYLGDISIDTLRRAIAICSWHLNEFKRLFGAYPQSAQIEQDALDIEQCIRNFHLEKAFLQRCPKNRIAQYAPKPLRTDNVRREAAFNFLVQRGRIQYLNFANDRTTYVDFIPAQALYMVPILVQDGYSGPPRL